MAKQTGYQLRTPRTSVRQAKTGICRQVARRSVRGSLELPPIGWQLFLLGNSKSDSTAFPSFLDTYATRLLAEPLSSLLLSSISSLNSPPPLRRTVAQPP